MEREETRKDGSFMYKIEALEHVFNYEDMACIKNSLNKNRSFDSRSKDINYCINEILLKVNEKSLLKDIFNIILDASAWLLDQILCEIGDVLKCCDFTTFSNNIGEKLATSLSVCSDILSLLQTFTKYLIRNSPFQFELVENVPKIIATICKNVFTHCKNGESLYSTYFQQIGDKVTCVFKKCHQLQIEHLTLLTDCIYFDLSQNHQRTAFLEVLDLAIDIGELVIPLDIKSMAEQWKGYIKLCEKYCDYLKDEHFVHIKATKILCKHIEDDMESLHIFESKEYKDVLRGLKSDNFMLKVVIKICQLFEEAMSRDIKNILHLVFVLQQCSSAYVRSKGFKELLINDIHSHINVGCELLIQIFISQESFRNYCLDYMKKDGTETQHLCSILLTVNVMKALLQCPNDVRDSWMETSDRDSNIIHILFYQLNNRFDLFLKYIKFEWDNLKGGRMFLYDYLLSLCAALIISSKDVSSFELIMLTNILEGNIWAAIFSIDLWLVILRFCPIEMHFEQLMFMMEVYEDLCNSELLTDAPHKVFLTCLMKNMFDLLAEKHKYILLKKYPIEGHIQLWNALGTYELSQENVFSPEIFISKTNDLFRTISDSKVNKQDYCKLLEQFHFISTFSEEQCRDVNSKTLNELLNNLLELWLRLVTETNNSVLENYSKRQYHWMNKYCITLSNLTSNFVCIISSDQLVTILQTILSFFNHITADIKISILYLLKSITYIEVCSNHVIQNVSKLFRYLLHDSDYLIRVLGLQIFAHLATYTSCKSIISETVNGDDVLKQNLTDFIKKKSSSYNEENGYKSNKFVHNCFTYSLPQTDSSNFEMDDSSESNISKNKRIKLENLEEQQTCEDLLDLISLKTNELILQKEKIRYSTELKSKLSNVHEILNSIL